MESVAEAHDGGGITGLHAELLLALGIGQVAECAHHDGVAGFRLAAGGETPQTRGAQDGAPGMGQGIQQPGIQRGQGIGPLPAHPLQGVQAGLATGLCRGLALQADLLHLGGRGPAGKLPDKVTGSGRKEQGCRRKSP